MIRHCNGMHHLLVHFATIRREKTSSSCLILRQGIRLIFQVFFLQNQESLWSNLQWQGISERIAQVLCQRKPTWPWLLLRLRLGRSPCPSWDGSRPDTQQVKNREHTLILRCNFWGCENEGNYFSEKSSWRCLKTWWQMAIMNGKESLRIIYIQHLHVRSFHRHMSERNWERLQSRVMMDQT